MALLAALFLCGACFGCSQEKEPTPQERHARRYVPFETEWRYESEIPREPQKSSHMVIWEVSRYAPGAQPEPESRRAAENLLERCRDSAIRHGWYDYEQGLTDGFRLPQGPGGVVHDRRHFRNDEFMLDDRILDPDRPEYLMYYPTPQGTQKLVGLMFFARTPTERGPQIGGPLTVWHYHKWRTKQCTVQGILPAGWAEGGDCEEGVGSHRSAEMLHVWLIDHPEGPFATSMYLEDYIPAEGLDAPFVVPEGDDIELFMASIAAAISQLDVSERNLVSEAIAFLTFALVEHAADTGSDPIGQRDHGDLVTQAQLRLYRLAQKAGRSMTLRRFIALALELKDQQPKWWSRYQELDASRLQEDRVRPTG